MAADSIQPIGSVSGSGSAQAASTVSSTGTGAGQANGTGGSAGLSTTDAVDLSGDGDEDDDGGVNPLAQGLGGSSDSNAAGATGDADGDHDKKAKDKQSQDAHDAQAAKQKKVDEEQKKLKELDKKINDTHDQLQQAIQSGDQAKAAQLNDQMGQYLKQREGLAQQLQNDQSALSDSGDSQSSLNKPVAGAQNINPGASSQPMNGGGAPMSGGGGMGGGVPMSGGGGMGGGVPMSGGGGMGGGQMAWPPNMMQGGAGNPAGVSANSTDPIPPINLQGNDKKEADFINNYLASKKSPAASDHAGELMVQYGKKYNVDPLMLLSIAGQETNFGKTGIGANGMLGVGAYDSNPNNATTNPTFAGVANQIRVGAETFANLRAKGGSSASDSVANQAAAVNRAGWATDPNWHNGVAAEYSQISQAAQNYQGS